MDKRTAAKELKAAARAFRKAHRAEMKAVGELADVNPKPAAIERCWKLAAAANDARNALAAAVEALELAGRKAVA